MTLAERIAIVCSEPGCSDPRIRDGRWCRAHTLEVLRETRHTSPWVRLASERRLPAKVLA